MFKKKETYLDETKYKDALKNQKEKGFQRLVMVATKTYGDKKGRRK